MPLKRTIATSLAVAVAAIVGTAFYDNGDAAKRWCFVGLFHSIRLGIHIGVLEVHPSLDEHSTHVKALNFIQMKVIQPQLESFATLEDFKTRATPPDQPEPMANFITEASLPPGVTAHVIEMTSSLDGHVIEADIILPPGVTELHHAKGALITLHGGGHVSGSRKTEFGIAGLFVNHTGFAALNMRVRLLPEHTFEQHMGDVVAAFHHLRSEGFESSQISFHGCSAGANLALRTTFELMQLGHKPGALVLSSPGDAANVFNAKRFPSLAENADRCMLAVPRIQEIIHGALTPAMERELSFLERDFTGFPPVRAVLGSTDVLLDHGVALGELLESQGVDVVVDVRPGGWHCPMSGSLVVPESRTAVFEAAEWLSKVVLSE